MIDFAGDLAYILSSLDTKINEIIEGCDVLAQNAYFDMYTTMKNSLDKVPKLVDALGKVTTSVAGAFSAVDEQLQSDFKFEG